MRTSPADIRNAVLLGVASIAAGFVVPVLPFVGLPLAAFALGWIAYRFGPAKSAGLAVAAGAVVAVFGPSLIGTAPLDGAFVAVAMLAIGPATSVALRRFSAITVAAVVTAVITLAFLVSPVGVELHKLSAATWTQVTVAAQASPNADAAAKATAQETLKQMLALWPALAFYAMGIGTAIGMSLQGRAAGLLDQEVHRYGPLADVDITFHVVWATILGLACAAAGSFWAQAPSFVSTAGSNVLTIVRPFLFLQGAAVFASLYRKMNAGRFTRAIGITLLVLTELFLPSVSLLGVVDLFINFRKVPRPGVRAPGALA